MDMDTECIIIHMETLRNIHMDTNKDMDTECIISHIETLHGVYIHMECQPVSTLCNIHPKSVHRLKPVFMMLISSLTLKGTMS